MSEKLEDCFYLGSIQDPDGKIQVYFAVGLRPRIELGQVTDHCREIEGRVGIIDGGMFDLCDESGCKIHYLFELRPAYLNQIIELVDNIEGKIWIPEELFLEPSK